MFLVLIEIAQIIGIVAGQQEPSAFCFDCAGRRNNKDLYADPDDCHKYYQCFYHADSTVSGIHRSCPSHQFWSEKLLTCLPEASGNPCQDLCQLQNGTKCHQVSGNCASFFICANTASYPMCCPEGTAFDQATCSCELDATCQDKCQLPDAFAATTETARPEVVDADRQVCRDSFGNYFRAVTDQPSSYWQYQFPQSNVAITHEFGDRRRVKRHCPPGLDFNLNSCSCSEQWPDLPQYKRQGCLLFLPFDVDFNDYSSNRFQGSSHGDVNIDKENMAHGSGSLSLNRQGRIEIAGFKSLSIPGSASWCLAYRCPNGDNCSGGLVSNSGAENHFSFSLSLLQNGSVEARVLFVNPKSSLTLTGRPSQSSPFTQVCVVFNAEQKYVSLFLNGQEVQSVTIDQVQIDIGHCPYTIGSDPSAGNFSGFIDDVLVCPWAFDLDDLSAHLDGPDALVNRDYIPDNDIFVDRGFVIETHPREPVEDMLRKLSVNVVSQRFMEVVGQGFPGFAMATIVKTDDREVDTFNIKTSSMQRCASVLIKNSWILLSARCLLTKLRGEISEFVITFGFANGTMAMFRIGYKYFVHGAFRRDAEIGEAPFDYALVKLDRPIVHYTKFVYPMRIPDPVDMCTKQWEYVNQTNMTEIDGVSEAHEIGYGYNANSLPLPYDNYTGETFLKVGPVSFISREDCQLHFGWHTIVPDTQMCAIDRKTLIIREVDQPISRLLILPGKTDNYGFKTDYILGLLYDFIDSTTGNPVYMYSRICRVWDWIAVTMKRNS